MSPRARRKTVDRDSAVGALTRGSHVQLLRQRLKKSVLERWLKCAAVGFTDPKLRSDFQLGGAMDFHVYPAALCQ